MWHDDDDDDGDDDGDDDEDDDDDDDDDDDGWCGWCTCHISGISFITTIIIYMATTNIIDIVSTKSTQHYCARDGERCAMCSLAMRIYTPNNELAVGLCCRPFARVAPETQVGSTATASIARSISLRQLIRKTENQCKVRHESLQPIHISRWPSKRLQVTQSECLDIDRD